MGASDSSFTCSLRIVDASVTDGLSTISIPTPGGAYGSKQLATPLAPGAALTVDDLTPGSWNVRCTHAGGATSNGTHAVTAIVTTTVSCN